MLIIKMFIVGFVTLAAFAYLIDRVCTCIEKCSYNKHSFNNFNNNNIKGGKEND